MIKMKMSHIAVALLTASVSLAHAQTSSTGGVGGGAPNAAQPAPGADRKGDRADRREERREDRREKRKEDRREKHHADRMKDHDDDRMKDRHEERKREHRERMERKDKK
jgi:hypothetical protein